MIGIKGVGMTMLAQFFAGKNIEVIGSDIGEKYMTDEVLKKAGIKVIEKFDENNIPKDTDLIVYSTAYNEDNNVEVKKALNGKIKTLKYAEALGDIFNQNYGIAVCGSHGKTTTTAWLGYVLDKCGKSPNVLVGAQVPQFDGNTLVGKSDYFVAELDEYQNKLKYFNPQIVLLNNIDYDHPDYFKTREDYTQVFVDFISKIPGKGILVANFDDEIVRKISHVNTRGRVVSYAINESADYVAYDIKSENGKQYFKVKVASEDEDDDLSQIDLGDFAISLSGKHNVYNALAVIAVCSEMEIDLVDIRTHLEEFTGTARRMQKMGEYKGAEIIDDYAHHPTEIKATLAGAREVYGDKRLVVVFHPHTYTRTKALLGDFAESFGDADEVIVLDIYGSAREAQGGVSSADLVEKIKNKNEKIKNISYIPTLGEAEKYLRENVSRGDVVILMGAGDVFRIGENLVNG
jgi:UDP-N-acetylmuramate--alanine ligase